MARLIKTNGAAFDVFPNNGKIFTLEELQGFVGGYIEFVRLDGAANDKEGLLKNKVMCLNEEGKLEGLPENKTATLIAEGCLFDDDYIAGDALLMSPSEIGEEEEEESSVCSA